MWSKVVRVIAIVFLLIDAALFGIFLGEVHNGTWSNWLLMTMLLYNLLGSIIVVPLVLVKEEDI